LRILCKLSQQKIKVLFIERHITVQVANNLIWQVGYFSVACIEGMNLPGKMSFLTLGHSDQLYPRVASQVFLHDVVGAISRSVAHYDPLKRKDRLRHHRLQGKLDVLSFISRRSNKNISREPQHILTTLLESWAF